jgi:hypothetical protein
MCQARGLASIEAVNLTVTYHTALLLLPHNRRRGLYAAEDGCPARRGGSAEVRRRSEANPAQSHAGRRPAGCWPERGARSGSAPRRTRVALATASV